MHPIVETISSDNPTIVDSEFRISIPSGQVGQCKTSSGYVVGDMILEKSEDESLRNLIQAGSLADSDKNIATSIMNDLQDALGYIPQ